MIKRPEFKPAWWLPGAHAQTIWPVIVKRKHAVDLAWERLELPDRDFVDLVWTRETGGPLIVLLHGLEGCIDSHYIKGMLTALHDKGWRGVLMHFRGCSGIPNRLARGYHSGDTGDLAYLIKQLQTRHPQRPLAAVGYSLGGNVLLKYLAERTQTSGLNAAVAVSVPFDLARSADRLNSGFSRIYQHYLLQRLQQRIMAKFKNRQDAPFAITDVPRWRCFHQFDHHVTAPLHGFASGAEYYRLASSRPCLKSISIPTLIIQAADDPFLSRDAIPIASELADNVMLELSEAGGHAGFISGKLPWRPRYWLEQRIPEFLSDYLI